MAAPAELKARECERCGKEREVLDSGWLDAMLCADCLAQCITDLQAALESMQRPVPLLPAFLRRN